MTRRPMPAFRPARQRGVAVLVAMLVVALAATAATAFVFRTQVEWRRLENLMRQDQARWVLRTAERWGAAVLRDDARLSSVDHPREAWATQLPPVEAEGYRVSGHMEDQDGRFNLNNLVVNGAADVRQVRLFARLLGHLKLPASLSAAVVDWMDADEVPQDGEGAESAYYMTRPTPYRAANRPLVNLNELLRVKGFDRQVLAALRPFVTVLPGRTPVNVNTARAEVLAALVEQLSLNDAYDLVARRDRAYYRNIQDFRQALRANLSAPDDLIAVSSSYFVVQARIRHERLSLGSHALFHRAGTSPPTLVWRAEL